MIQILKNSLIKKYFQFSGRASRKEYWIIYIFYIGLGYFSIFIYTFSLKVFYFLFLLLFLFLLPSITVCVRRLHDINFSGWWFLLLNMLIIIAEYYDYKFFFIIAWIGAILLGLIQGNLTINKYGEPPVN